MEFNKYTNNKNYPTGVSKGCEKCHIILKKDDKFCSECGEPFHESYMARKTLYNKDISEYNKEDARIMDEFKNDALTEVGYENHPKKDIIFDKAWVAGHSSGYYSVFVELEDLCDFLDDIIDKKATENILTDALENCLDCLGNEYPLPSDVIDEIESVLKKSTGL